jgi:DNA-binding XRE family transcriptional regulator
MNEIKRIRKILQLSQKDFGELVNVTQGAIHLYEAGERFPRRKTAKAIILLAQSKGINTSIEAIYFPPDQE